MKHIDMQNYNKYFYLIDNTESSQESIIYN